MEILDLYDDFANKLGETINRGSKTEIGKNIMLSVVYIKNNEGKYLIQKQSKEKGNRYSSTGGHVIHNEDGLTTIVRELYEELSINVDKNNIKYIDTFKYPNKNCLFNVYLLDIDNLDITNIKLQEDEVSEVFWLDVDEINNLILQGNFLESHAYIFQHYINVIN